MITIKHSIRKLISLCLSICLLVTSMNQVTWALESDEGQDVKAWFTLDGQEIKEMVINTINHDQPLSADQAKELGINLQDSTALWELFPSYDVESNEDVQVDLRVFVRADGFGAGNVGDAVICFLLQNEGQQTVRGRVQTIQGFQTPFLSVKGYNSLVTGSDSNGLTMEEALTGRNSKPYEVMLAQLLLQNASASDAVLVVRQGFYCEGDEYTFQNQLVEGLSSGTNVVSADYRSLSPLYQLVRSEPENLILQPGENQITLYYQADQEEIEKTVRARSLQNSKGRSRSYDLSKDLPEGTVGASKTARWTDMAARQAVIELAVKGSPTRAPVDVLLVMDASSSMSETISGSNTVRYAVAKSAALSLFESFLGPEQGGNNKYDDRVGITIFGDQVVNFRYLPGSKELVKGWNELWDEDMQSGWMPEWNTAIGLSEKEDKHSILNVLNLYSYISASGKWATYYFAGLQKANEIVTENKQDNRDIYIIFMSDGLASDYATRNDILDEASKIKQQATLFTVGVAIDKLTVGNDANNAKTLLENMATDETCYYNLDEKDFSSLGKIFTKITGKIRNAGRNAVITDQISDEFEVDEANLPEGVTYDSGTHTVTWNIGEIVSQEQRVAIPVRLKLSASEIEPGKPYPTNKQAILTYKDIKDQNARMELDPPFLTLDLGAADIRYCLANENGAYITADGFVLPDQNDPSYRVEISRDQMLYLDLNPQKPYPISPSATVTGKDNITYTICPTAVTQTFSPTEQQMQQTFYYPVYKKTTQNVNYRVNYFEQNKENGSYSPTVSYSKEVQNAKVGAEITLKEGDLEIRNQRYVLDDRYAAGLTNTIKEDGTTEFLVYLKYQYEINYLPGAQGTFAKETLVSYYGQPTPSYGKDITGNPDYLFQMWNPKLADTVTHDMDYTAQWIKADANYTIAYYHQNPKDGSYALAHDEVKRGVTGWEANIVPEQLTIPDRYVFDSTHPDNVLSALVTADGKTLLKVYLKYPLKITYAPGVRGDFPQKEFWADYGQSTPAFGESPKAKGDYSFIGWSPKPADTVTQDMVYEALWKSWNTGGSGGGSGGGPGGTTGGKPDTGPGPGNQPEAPTVNPPAPIDPDQPSTWPQPDPENPNPAPPPQRQPDGSITVVVPTVPPNTDVSISTPEGDLIFRGNTDDQGQINALLPPGDYILIAIDEQGVPLAQMTFTILDEEPPLANLPKTGRPGQSCLWYQLLLGVLLAGYICYTDDKKSKERKSQMKKTKLLLPRLLMK